jgi:hypothetical protein
MPMPRPTSTALFSAALFAATLPAHAFQSADPNFKGLPGGGGLDGQRVMELRYGEAAQAAPQGSARASSPSTPVASTFGTTAPAAPQAAPRESAKAMPALAAPARIKGALATVWLERTGKVDDAKVPLTFGQVFAPSALPRGARLAGKLADGSAVALQTDVKARHADGSVRHAVISAILPAPKDTPLALGLVKADGEAGASKDAAGVADLLRAGLTASVKATVDGVAYGASLDKLLARAKPTAWLAGPVAQEWHASAPLAASDGKEHPHLAARFALRWYPALKKARVDVTVENNWAFEPDPQAFTYNAEITVGGKQVYAKDGLTHFHHARWRKLAWWGGEPALHLRHDPRQLIDTLALPNYDPALRIDDKALANLMSRWEGGRIEPMGVGLALPGMPTTGGRIDIGLLPGWAVMHLLSMDPRAATFNMGTADLAGSWSVHYRDRRTGHPVSLIDYPYMTIIGTVPDTRNPATGKNEKFPPCARPDACKNPGFHDTSHQPNFAYLPYLLSGDYYYLEELQFWAQYNVFWSNPKYRQYRKGLLGFGQVRGQAWSLRALAEAAYITPDNHPLKAHFTELVNSNLDWYNAEYPNNPDANKLGYIAGGSAIVYRKMTAVSSWQDDFFTQSVGHAAELGFAKARPILRWKARFPVERMIGEGGCWMDGANYSLAVRADPKGPLFNTIAEVFRASRPEAVNLACGSAEMAAALKVKPGEMTGYAKSAIGYPSNMQPALAYAADALGEPGRKAWRQFMARSVKPDYTGQPQFAIVPRED